MANQYTYIPINKEKIIEVYINSNRSMKEASIILGCSIKKLWKDLQFYKIQAKSNGGK